jgi:hypothetical protein
VLEIHAKEKMKDKECRCSFKKETSGSLTKKVTFLRFFFKPPILLRYNIAAVKFTDLKYTGQ